MVMDYTNLALVVAAVYCAAMYAILVFRTFRRGEDWENETFHLGLCFILAVGFLHLGG
jgi:hypothetical protein